MISIDMEEGAARDAADVALEMLADGWLPVPLRHRGKEPPSGFPLKGWLGSDPTEAEIAENFRGRLNIGVALGGPSGGLTCRDFDREGEYESWRERYPHIASRLPTVKTSRGYHCYFYSTPYEFTSHCRAGSSGTILLLPEGQGEIRRGGYAVYPPSVHPSGFHYRTIQGGDPVFISDLLESGLIPSEVSPPFGGEQCPSYSQAIACVPLTDIDACIELTLPMRPGQRNQCLFGLVRRLRSHPKTRDSEPDDLREIVERWYRLAYPKIRTRDFRVTWRDFLIGWQRCRIPAGATIGVIASKAQGHGIERLADLCRLLQERAGDRPFFLAGRSAAAALGLTPRTAARWLNKLRQSGRIELVRPGDRWRHRAREYRYLGPPNGA